MFINKSKEELGSLGDSLWEKPVSELALRPLQTILYSFVIILLQCKRNGESSVCNMFSMRLYSTIYFVAP